MGKYKNIPIAAAKRVAKEYDKDQVIILTWDKAFNKTHVTTFGKTMEDCDQAAEGGNRLKKALGWPEEMCKDEPSRVKKMKAEIKKLKARVKELEE
jgi:hypothetical protein